MKKEKHYYRRLKDTREDKDKQQKEIASYLNITQQQYSLYENGDREIPVHLIKKLAKYYNISLDYLTEITDIQTSINSNEKLTAKDLALLSAYKNKGPALQEAVDKLLDITETNTIRSSK